MGLINSTVFSSLFYFAFTESQADQAYPEQVSKLIAYCRQTDTTYKYFLIGAHIVSVSIAIIIKDTKKLKLNLNDPQNPNHP